VRKRVIELGARVTVAPDTWALLERRFAQPQPPLLPQPQVPPMLMQPQAPDSAQVGPCGCTTCGVAGEGHRQPTKDNSCSTDELKLWRPPVMHAMLHVSHLHDVGVTEAAANGCLHGGCVLNT
jgi:hypothetical protein